ncbi:MAG: hypothetical protein M1156_01710 [Candidatus Marsarchaeota archaeon]|nr:hypothetical protein [Candidatus Marsarchaeota archaeon]
MDIARLFTQSFSDILANPKALLPSIVMLLAVFAVAIFILLAVFVPIIKGLSGNFHNITEIKSLTVTPTGAGIAAFKTKVLNVLFSAGGQVLIYVFVFAAVIALASVLISGVVIAIGGQIYRKRKLSLSEAVRVAASRYLSLLGAGAAEFAIIAAVFLIAFAAVMLTFSLSHISESIVVAVITGILLILISVFIEILFFMVNTIIILDNKGAIESMREGFMLAWRNKVEVIIILLLMFVISMIASFAEAIINIIPIAGVIVLFLVDVFISVWFGFLPVYFYMNLNVGNRAAGGNGVARRKKAAQI